MKVIPFFLFLLFSFPASAQEYIISEEFSDLENWEPLYFPKVDRHSRYSVIREGEDSYLMAESEDAASGLIYSETFDVYSWPVLTWRWKVEDIIPSGDARKKKGDDYSIRIYVIFKYDPAGASGFKRFQYNMARAVYGEYPPDSGLNYVWANRSWGAPFVPNSHSGRVVMIAMDTGPGEAGLWKEHRVNILEDYRRIFGTDPPSPASLAVMTDSDNTDSAGKGYIDYIRIGKED